MAPLIFNIQRFSIHDGEGIRTVLFFKGCPLSCAWCHNPESQRPEKELLFFHERCTSCGACVKLCPQGASRFEDGRIVTDRTKCTACGVCAENCPADAREIAGKEYSGRELVHEALKDRMFYEQSGGGVTLSGGEVMAAAPDFVEELCRALYEEGLSVDIDTAGFCPYENFKRILPYIDTVLFDLKHMDAEGHRRWTGAAPGLIFENLKKLSKDGAKIRIRLPLVGKVNADEDHIRRVIRFLKENEIAVSGIDLLAYHNTGSGKYGRLDRPYDADVMAVPGKELLEEFRQMFIESGYLNTRIGG